MTTKQAPSLAVESAEVCSECKLEDTSLYLIPHPTNESKVCENCFDSIMDGDGDDDDWGDDW